LIYLRGVRAQTLPAKVISVGNITVGGTGKTTLVEYIARRLKSQGHTPAILSRGYKRGNSLGDEPRMLMRHLKDVPVVVDADRIAGARRAIKEHGADCLILDDGFQQWHIKKDLEIVAIDASNPFGNRQLLPRGILREPLSSLRRAQVLVLTKCNLSPELSSLKNALLRRNPLALIVESEHAVTGIALLGEMATALPDSLSGKRVCLVSGIGDPDSFERVCALQKMQVVAHFRFPDHHAYSKDDFSGIARGMQEAGSQVLVTTEKDAERASFRLQASSFKLKIYVLHITLTITANEAGFIQRLSGV
jgi:tetraacyldisaccharide 4'-kinase